jgi:hypothetical protein
VDLPNTTNLAAGGGILATIAGSLYVLVNIVRGNRVTEASDDAQVNIIKVLQDERDSAVKRADEAVAQREAAMNQLTDMRLQIQALQTQVQHLSEQIEALTAAKIAAANSEAKQ